MTTVLFLKSTTLNSTPVAFDANITIGASLQTAVVDTAAAGTNIQWTATAGGAVVRWISGRSPVGGWTLAGQVDCRIFAQESNALANAKLRVRLYHRAVNGTETELGGSPWDAAAEMPTTPSSTTLQFTPTSQAFLEDERLVIEMWVTNAGTMASGHTCTLRYNDSGANNANSRVILFETITFKAEPPGVFAMAGTGTMAGIGWSGDVPENPMSLALREAYALAPTADMIMHTLEIRHPSFVDVDGNPDSAWIVSDQCDFVGTIEYGAPVRGSEEVNFTAFAFQFHLPNIEPGAEPEIEIIIDNVSRELTEQFDRAVEDPTPITIIYRPYLASDPSMPQMDPPAVFQLSDVNIGALRVTCRARTGVDLRGAFPLARYTATAFPGLIGN